MTVASLHDSGNWPVDRLRLTICVRLGKIMGKIAFIILKGSWSVIALFDDNDVIYDLIFSAETSLKECSVQSSCLGRRKSL